MSRVFTEHSTTAPWPPPPPPPQVPDMATMMVVSFNATAFWNGCPERTEIIMQTECRGYDIASIVNALARTVVACVDEHLAEQLPYETWSRAMHELNPLTFMALHTHPGSDEIRHMRFTVVDSDKGILFALVGKVYESRDSIISNMQ